MSSIQALDHDDPRVEAARTAEKAAYEHYGREPEAHYLQVPELTLQIRVIEVGTGPPVVLIPGGHGPGCIWIPFLPELDGYTAYIMDRPGGGLSDGIDYRSVPLRRLAACSTRALFDHFDLDRAPVIGNSMGGLWSLRFALEHPDRAAALVFLGCPAVYPGTSAPLPMRVGSVPGLSAFIVENMMRSSDPAGARETLEFLGQPTETIEHLPDEFLDVWYRMEDLPHFTSTWASLLQSVLSLFGANDDAAFTAEDLRAIQCPVSLIWGSEDPFGNVETGREGSDNFSDAEFHEVGVGHLPWLDEPERCGELVRAFLDQKTGDSD